MSASLKARPVVVTLPDDLPPILVDGVAIQQVLVNLLDNALKYSPPETAIRISARISAAAVEVQIHNEGEAIPPDNLETIFDRFFRVRTTGTHAVRGTGLGLAICRGIIVAHGGKIWAESSPGQGTSLLFTLPLTGTPSSLHLGELAERNPSL